MAENKGNGQKIAESFAAQPFRPETTMGAMSRLAGAPDPHRYDRELGASVWPQNAVPVPTPKAPIKILYRHDAGAGQGMDK